MSTGENVTILPVKASQYLVPCIIFLERKEKVMVFIYSGLCNSIFRIGNRLAK